MLSVLQIPLPPIDTRQDLSCSRGYHLPDGHGQQGDGLSAGRPDLRRTTGAAAIYPGNTAIRGGRR